MRTRSTNWACGWISASFCFWLALLSGCGKPSSQNDSVAADKQFPGFQRVGDSGDAAQLRFNPTDFSRNGNEYVFHAVKSFPEGYSSFDVLTNCRDSTQRLAGTQYRSDGTAEHAYPGNDSPVLAKSEPGMGELMQKACAAAIASRSIPGEFNIPAALEILYGSYDARRKAAIWEDAELPATLKDSENLMLQPGKPVRVSSAAIFDFSEQGKQKKVLVTNAVPESGGCHACTGLLGIAVFVKDEASWKVESNDPYVASLGASGTVGDRFEWQPAGDDKFALVIGGNDMHGGIATVYTDVFVRENGKFSHLLTDGVTGESEEEKLNVATVLLKGKNNAHYDAKISLSYEMPGQPKYIENHEYQYVGDKYVLVRKDDPPKYAKSTPPAPLPNPAPAPISKAAPAGVLARAMQRPPIPSTVTPAPSTSVAPLAPVPAPVPSAEAVQEPVAEATPAPAVTALRPRPGIGLLIKGMQGQLVVVEVKPDSPAARAGIEAQDVLLRACLRSFCHSSKRCVNWMPEKSIPHPFQGEFFALNNNLAVETCGSFLSKMRAG